MDQSWERIVWLQKIYHLIVSQQEIQHELLKNAFWTSRLQSCWRSSGGTGQKKKLLRIVIYYVHLKSMTLYRWQSKYKQESGCWGTMPMSRAHQTQITYKKHHRRK